MRLLGIILFIVGLVATFIFGLEAYQNTESVKFLGTQITLSQANWTPVIISGAVALIGLVMLLTSAPKGKGRKR